MGELVKERYALSLYQVAEKQNLIYEIYEQLEQTKEIFEQNDVYFSLLKNSYLEKEERKQLLQNVFVDKLHSYVLNFLKLLIDKERMDLFLEIVHVYRTKYFEDKNIKEFIAITSKPLISEQRRNLEEQLKCSIGAAEVRLCNKIDPEIIGGIKLKSQNQEIDKSVQTMLRNMKKDLEQMII